MGSDSSKGQIGKINMNEWMNIGVEDGAEIVRSNVTKQEGEIRLIPLDPKHEIDKQSKIYTYRKYTDIPLVKCLGAEFSKSQNRTVCGNQQNVKVLTERIPKRLSNINSFTFPESLYVLSESLIGFQDLNQKAGRFEVYDNMIGFNNNGEAKVWLNDNFAENHPVSERPILQTTMTNEALTGGTSEQKVVKTIYDLVENKCQGGFPQDFYHALWNKTKTYHEAFNTIQQYVEDKNINVPDRIMQPMTKNQSEIQRVSMTYQPNNNNNDNNSNSNNNNYESMRRQSPSFSEPSQFRSDEIDNFRVESLRNNEVRNYNMDEPTRVTTTGNMRMDSIQAPSNVPQTITSINVNPNRNTNQLDTQYDRQRELGSVPRIQPIHSIQSISTPSFLNRYDKQESTRVDNTYSQAPSLGYNNYSYNNYNTVNFSNGNSYGITTYTPYVGPNPQERYQFGLLSNINSNNNINNRANVNYSVSPSKNITSVTPPTVSFTHQPANMRAGSFQSSQVVHHF